MVRRRMIGTSWRVVLACILLAALLPLGSLPVAGDEPVSDVVSADVSASVVNQVKKLTAGDGAASDHFGNSVAISGETIVVGAHFAQVGSNAQQGSAYVFQRNQGWADNWGLVRKLVAGDGGASDHFGFSVAISGNTIVVGTCAHDEGGNFNQGSAYVFDRNRGGTDHWGQAKELVASDGAIDDQFGCAVAISGDTIVVGARHDSVGSNYQGSAYVFYRDLGGAGNWGQAKQLLAADAAESDYFGRSVAISGNTIVVGAHLDDVGGNVDQGSLYVFYRNTGGNDQWGQVAHLTADDGTANDQFGTNVAINGDTIVAGSPDHTVGSADGQGAAYVFGRNQGGADTWGQVRRLLAGDGATGDHFGDSTAISGDTIVVGSDADDVGSTTDQGSGYVFSRNLGGANNWGESQQLTAGDGAENDYLGLSVGISGQTIVVGSSWDDVGSTDQGSAYVFAEPAAQPRLRKWAERSEYPAGWVVRYTIRVVNDTPKALKQIVVIDTLPANVQFVSADPAGYTRVGRQVKWTLRNVPAGARRDLHVQVRTYSTTRGLISNRVDATGSNGYQSSATCLVKIVAP